SLQAPPREIQVTDLVAKLRRARHQSESLGEDALHLACLSVDLQELKELEESRLVRGIESPGAPIGTQVPLEISRCLTGIPQFPPKAPISRPGVQAPFPGRKGRGWVPGCAPRGLPYPPRLFPGGDRLGVPPRLPAALPP